MNFPLYVDGYPTLYDGVLSANGEQSGIGKGKVLSAFLKQVGMEKGKLYGSGYVPKIVIFVDDKKKNLEDVRDALSKDFPEMQYVGIEYQGAFDYASKDISEEEIRQFWQKVVEQIKKKV